MNCNNILPGGCEAADYGVSIKTVPGFGDRADIYGWAWSDVVGWICVGKTCAGTTPEGAPPYAQFRENIAGGTKHGQFVGWMHVVALGDHGWISLNCENTGECADSDYFVSFDNTTGQFAPPEFNSHWGWSGTDGGTGIGWVDFSSVVTDWVYPRIGKVRRPEGVYEPFNPALPGTHLSTFEVGLYGFSSSKNYRLDCRVRLPDMSSKILTRILPDLIRDDMNPITPEITMEYTVSPTDVIDDNQPWIIQACQLSSTVEPEAGPCVTDIDCPPNRMCDDTLNLCRTVVDTLATKRPIFTHGNLWSGLGSGEDQYRAVKCHAGFPGVYLKNPSYCDFTGDASFSMAMRRGIPVEGDCHDGIDNDGNGQTDCDDRYCKGISYFCAPHSPTRCIWGASGDGVMDCSDPLYHLGGSDLCCTRQPTEQGSDLYHIAYGLECEYGDPDDGYYDCMCTTSEEFDESLTDDCFAPGYQSGDLCCNEDSVVVKL